MQLVVSMKLAAVNTDRQVLLLNLFKVTNLGSSSVLVTYCCCNKLTQPQLLQTIPIISHWAGGQKFSGLCLWSRKAVREGLAELHSLLGALKGESLPESVGVLAELNPVRL